jgi:feruloyl esterase
MKWVPQVPRIWERETTAGEATNPRCCHALGQWFRYAVFQDVNWDYKTFDFDSGMAVADRLDNGLFTNTDPHLRAFFQRGGKLLQYHGWSDPGISPLNSVNYYRSVLEFTGGIRNVRGSYRLFMVPRDGSLLRRRWAEHFRSY